MSMTTNVLTQAGLTKMIFLNPVTSNPSFSGKIRLYAFLNQEPEAVAKIQEIFTQKIKGKSYQGIISDLSKDIKMKPYLLRLGNCFHLILTQEVFLLERKWPHTEQEKIDFYNQILRVAIKMNDQADEKMAYRSLGNISTELGNYREAITYHKKDLEISLFLKDLRGEGRAYSNLGIAYDELGKYRKAMASHEKSLKIALELDDLDWERKAYCNLGNAYKGLGEYRKAIDYYEKSLKIALKLSDHVGEWKDYSRLGNAYQGLGEYRKAMAYHEEHLKIA
ncbi:MAG: tetratricopeptide repeat protein, partial [Candidatus Rhabdochlamydia sp.]